MPINLLSADQPVCEEREEYGGGAGGGRNIEIIVA